MDVEEVVRLLRAPDQLGVGRVREEVQDYGVPNIERLTELDNRSLSVRGWSPEAIPGLLQTPAYTAMLTRAAHQRLTDTEVYRRVQLKSARVNAFLHRTMTRDLGRSYFILSEAAIVNSLYDDEAHAVQLRHLLTLSTNDRICIQVLPHRKVTPGLAGHFLLYAAPSRMAERLVNPGAVQRVGYVETVMGAYYSTRMEDVSRLHSIFSEMTNEAMSQESSRQFVREVLHSWRVAKSRSAGLIEENPSSSPPTPTTPASELPKDPGA